MAKIDWNDGLSVKIEDIDTQHQKLINLVNDLDTALTLGKEKHELSGILCALVQYTQTHFAAEERLLTAHHYPKLDAHHAEHEKLLLKAIEVREKFQSGRITLSVPVMSFMDQWLLQHIKTADMEYSEFLTSKGEQ